MNKSLDSIRIQELYTAVERVVSRLYGSTLDDFLANLDLQDIALMQCVVLGEAAAHVSEATRQRYPQIAWRKAAATRNFIVHEYAKVDFVQVWDTVMDDLPGLLAELPAVLAQVLADEKAQTSV